ncbi:MAG: phosphoribosylglycinamide formyltransferase [Chitinophagales bacterium]|nr:phosphoribosylglycinamide formyltransferase [Chitinophagales bacterium]
MNAGSNGANKIGVAVFASGEGTNAENIIRYFHAHHFIDVRLIVANNPQAGVILRAERLGVPVKIFTAQEWKYPKQIAGYLKSHHVEFIVLAGYLKLIPAEFITEFHGRIINIHPALLPRFGGKGMYGRNIHQNVFDSKETHTGITIHLVNEKYDDGEIIFQKIVSIDENDTPETIEKKVRQLEQEFFPQVVEAYIQNIISL